jgi:CTP:molybdopterin cytidylyltransferase MocA
VKPILVVLAAGASRRLGRCKALVDLAGRSPLQRLLEAGTCLDAHPPLVVTGADHEAIARAAPGTSQVLHNPRWAEGRSGGVLLAHRQVPDRALCLAPVDVPLVSRPVFEALAHKWDELGSPPEGWLAPRLDAPGHPGDGRYGHPVVLGPALLASLATRAPSTSLRSLRPAARPVAEVAVADPAILDDLDRPEDLERLRRRLSPP